MLQINLIYLREKFDFTFTQLEKMFGFGRGSYANLERNPDQKIRPSQLLKIQKIYEAFDDSITLEKLLTVDLSKEKDLVLEQKQETSVKKIVNSSISISYENIKAEVLKNVDDIIITLVNERLKNNKSEYVKSIFS